MTDILLYDHRSSICSQMARLALVEKGVRFQRRQIDIMDTNEQFEPWYVALNPKAVVPTLQIGDEVVTDTIKIVNQVQALEGPDLSGDATTQTWLKDIMSLHYGVLMYRKRLGPDGTVPQIVARELLLKELSATRPDLAQTTKTRLEGNEKFQNLLQDPVAIEVHVVATKSLVDRMNTALRDQSHIAGNNYSLADCFATAALARFKIHGLDH
ncbi:MAG: glutathione S-transferase family protein, partial [Boseongicola sp.]